MPINSQRPPLQLGTPRSFLHVGISSWFTLPPLQVTAVIRDSTSVLGVSFSVLQQVEVSGAEPLLHCFYLLFFLRMETRGVGALALLPLLISRSFLDGAAVGKVNAEAVTGLFRCTAWQLSGSKKQVGTQLMVLGPIASDKVNNGFV